VNWYYYDEDTGMEYWHDGDMTRSQCHDGVGLVTTHTQSHSDFMALWPNAAELPNEPIQLIAKCGALHTPNSAIVDELQKEYWEDDDVILLFRYDDGDFDTINSESPNMEQLRSCLYDAREGGIIGDAPSSFQTAPLLIFNSFSRNGRT